MREIDNLPPSACQLMHSCLSSSGGPLLGCPRTLKNCPTFLQSPQWGRGCYIRCLDIGYSHLLLRLVCGDSTRRWEGKDEQNDLLLKNGLAAGEVLFPSFSLRKSLSYPVPYCETEIWKKDGASPARQNWGSPCMILEGPGEAHTWC